MRCVVVVLGVCLFWTQTGCLPRQGALPLAPTEALRATFGTVGVTWTPGIGTHDFDRPSTNVCAAMARGALRGIGAVLEPFGGLSVGGAGSNGAAIVMLGLMGAILAVALTLGSLTGALHGLSKAPSFAEVKASHARLLAGGLEVNLPKRVRDEFVEQARARTDVRVEPLEPGASRDRVDTVLEFGPPSFVLDGNIVLEDPPLQLWVTQPLRLVTVLSGRVLYETSFVSRGGSATVQEWGEQDASLFRQELEQTARDLAARAVEELLLIYLLPHERGAP